MVDERDSLELAPVLHGTAQQTLLSDATLNFAGSVGGPPLVQPREEGFRAERRFRLGCLRQRQDRRPRRLLHELRERPVDSRAGEHAGS